MATKKSTAERPKHLLPFTNDKQLRDRKPESKRYEISDAGCRGMRVRVEPTGSKAFIWYVRHEGKQQIVTIGTYPALSLAEARRDLDNLKQKHKDDTLFNTAHNTPKTVSDLCDEFYAGYIEKNRKRPDAVRQIYDHDVIPVIGNRKIKSIVASDINHLVKAVVNRGATVHAGKVLALVKQLFGYAVSMDYIEISPAASQKPAFLGIVNNVGDRHLDAGEITAFWSALDKAPRMSDPVRVAFKVLLLSGVRSGELRLAKWADINFDKKEWFIPAENTKNNRGWTVPLSSHLIEQFRTLESFSGGSAWVFAGKQKAGEKVATNPITDKVFGRAMRRLFELEIDGERILTIPSASPHDLRRTMRTGLSQLKVEPYIAERCLNHSLGKILQTYDKNEMLPERLDALERWGDYVDLLVTDRENITLMKKQA